MTSRARRAQRRPIAVAVCGWALVAVLGFGTVSCTSDPTPADGGSATAPTGGGLEGAPTVSRAPAIALTGMGDFGGGVTAKIVRIEPVQASASRPGDVGGPAVAVTVEIDNASSAPISLAGAAVSLSDANAVTAPSVSGAPAAPFAGMIVEGGKAEATYVFVVPADARNPVTVTLGYSPSSPTLVFAGDVAAG